MRICLIGVTHPCRNPRLLREADTLAQAGHEVRVVAPCYMPHLEEVDQRQIARRQWRYEKVDYCPHGWRGRIRSLQMRGRRKIAEKLVERAGLRHLRIVETSYITALPELIAAAMSEPADWFIAHAHGALPVAASAAHRWRAGLGFDCEDLLSENDPQAAVQVRLLERKYLPRCDYIATPSRGIAEYLQRDYQVNTPIVLYNVFPLALADGMMPPLQRPPSPKLRLHWFSQTIGPGRGLEEAVTAAGLLNGSAELHLRGQWAAGYEAFLTELAQSNNVSLKIYPLVDHDDLIRTFLDFDVGLALENPAHGNYSRTVTNKVGSYMLAGLAIAATDTPGQREVLDQAPSIGFLYPAGEPQALADGLRGWLERRESLQATQQAAWEAARARFCWDLEQDKLLMQLTARQADTQSAGPVPA